MSKTASAPAYLPAALDTSVPGAPLAPGAVPTGRATARGARPALAAASTFAGFSPPGLNETALPNELFDEWLARLSAAALRVLLYICRRTRGFHKVVDAISLTQFEHGIITTDGRRLGSQ